jgi:two-component system cell cycle sensor histidine kinase/response regulator CckA
MPSDGENSVRILVVDDEESVLTFAERALRDAGYDVTVASSGLDALRILGAQAPFDLFVIDMVMPLMSGDELARRLRRDNPDARVLYFTAYTEQLFSEKITLWENEAFLEKPVTVTGLLEAASLLIFGHTRGLTK